MIAGVVLLAVVSGYGEVNYFTMEVFTCVMSVAVANTGIT